MFTAQLPRRASAYDVYQNQGASPASRRSSFRIPQDDDVINSSLQQKGNTMISNEHNFGK